MHVIISPAKKIDTEPVKVKNQHTIPEFLNEAEMLIKELRKFNPRELSKLMDVSDNIAELNFKRFANWSLPFNERNAKTAILSFKGDVYQKLEVDQLSADDLDFAQKHLSILSGLYGGLRPLDIIQAYRLTMGTKLKTKKGKNLYEFWGVKIAGFINNRMKESGSNILINLASNEYFRSLKKLDSSINIITPVFKDFKNGKYKTLFLYAKQARGMMCRYIIKNNITNPEELKLFDDEGYHFDANLSNGNEWVFTR